MTSPLLEVLSDDVLASNFSCIELTAVVVDRALEASIEVSITPAVISLDDKIVEVLPESRYHLLRLTIERKKLTRTRLRAETLTKSGDEGRHVLRLDHLLFFRELAPAGISLRPRVVEPQVTFAFVVRLKVVVEAIKAKLIDKVTECISVLDDSSRLLSLSFCTRTALPSPVFFCGLIMGSQLSTDTIDLEAREDLRTLEGLYLLEVFATSFIELSDTSTPERDNTQAIGKAHELRLHRSSDASPTTKPTEAKRCTALLEGTQVSIVVLGRDVTTLICWLVLLELRPLGARGCSKYDDSTCG